MSNPDLSFECQYDGLVCGIDEAGRGPWAGPVVASAVILDIAHIPEGLNDSKKLSKTRREQLYEAIISSADHGIGVAQPEEIDRINILQASFLAMQRAFSGLSRLPNTALIDGNKAPKLPCHTQTIIKGDSRSLSIAAASIIAKVTRDRIMEELAKTYPGYGFENHSGYGTKQHKQALEKYGATPIHRKSYAPIKALLEQEKIYA